MWRDPWRYTSRIFEDADREFAEAEEMLNRMFRTVKEGSTAGGSHIAAAVLLRVPN